MSGGIIVEGSDRLYPFLTKTVCLETYDAARKGTVTLTVVPCPGSLSPNQIGKSGGLGLINMRERVHQLDGTFEFDSEPGHGTTVRVTVPFRAAS